MNNEGKREGNRGSRGAGTEERRSKGTKEQRGRERLLLDEDFLLDIFK